jgi:hypothetical protein
VRPLLPHLQTLFVDDLAIDHAHDPIGRTADADVVGDDQERQPTLAVQAAHQRHDILGVLAVEVSRRLVGPDDRRIVDERAPDRRPLPLPAESSSGTCAPRSANPTISSAANALRRASLAGTRATSSGNSTFSTALSTGIRF